MIKCVHRHAQTQLVGSVRTQAGLRVPHCAQTGAELAMSQHLLWDPAHLMTAATTNWPKKGHGGLSEGVSKGVWKCMSVWVYEWMSEWVSEWVSEWMNEWIGKWMNESGVRLNEWIRGEIEWMRLNERDWKNEIEWVGFWLNEIEWVGFWLNEIKWVKLSEWYWVCET